MNSDHQEPRKKAGPWVLSWGGFTLLIMVGLVACFAAQQVVIVRMEKPYDTYLALNSYGMKSGYFWQFFTCQTLHVAWWHLLVNLAGLWFIGRALETALGSLRFLAAFLGCALAGALLQGLLGGAGELLRDSAPALSQILLDRYLSSGYGSSLGLCGLLAIFSRRQPQEKVRLFYLIPLKKAILVWPALACALAFSLPSVTDNFTLTHTGHLGALLAGMAAARWLRPR